MSAEATVREYYEALRRGDPLAPFFADLSSETEDAAAVKYGIGERLVGHGAIAAGLRDQTRSTADWTVESGSLRVVERPDHAWFSDEVFMAWTDLNADRERAFETRWSGTLERREDEWLFVGMHVSVPRRIGEGEGDGRATPDRDEASDGNGTPTGDDTRADGDAGRG